MTHTKSGMNGQTPSDHSQPKEMNYRSLQSQSRDLEAGQDWYLAQCKPKGEQIALRNLKNQDFLVFLPMQRLTQRKGGSFKTRLCPLFPGYIFVSQDPDAGQWRKINNTRGVARLVRLGAKPTPVPRSIMDQLFGRCDARGVFQQNATLIAGDNATIIHGPFAGTIARIVDVGPNQRLQLLLNIMGQISTLKIDAAGVARTV